MIKREQLVSLNIIQLESQMDIEKALGTLPERQRRVIEEKYMSNRGTTSTNGEVGQRLGICAEAVRAREKKAFKQLKHPSRRKLFQGYH
jgi:RNA polymerase sigma factor (sigma-70 family)